MDCFFASVALRDRPKELSEKPVAVAHGQGSGGESSEIASCNYVARENGVKNGMFVGRAKQLCPEVCSQGKYGLGELRESHDPCPIAACDIAI